MAQCAALLVRTSDGKFVFVENKFNPNNPSENRGTTFPGGKADPNENFKHTALREFCEETAIPLDIGKCKSHLLTLKHGQSLSIFFLQLSESSNELLTALKKNIQAKGKNSLMEFSNGETIKVCVLDENKFEQKVSEENNKDKYLQCSIRNSNNEMVKKVSLQIARHTTTLKVPLNSKQGRIKNISPVQGLLTTNRPQRGTQQPQKATPFLAAHPGLALRIKEAKSFFYCCN